MRSPQRVVQFAFWGLALATVVPLWCGPYTSFRDVPQHAAMIATVRHYADPAWHFREFFVLSFAQSQYSLYYLLGAAIAWLVPSAETANALLLSATAVGFCVACRALARATRLDERIAFAAPLVFYTAPLCYGLINYVVALAVVFYALALFARELDHTSPRMPWRLAALSIVVFFLHLSSFVFFVACACTGALLTAWLEQDARVVGGGSVVARTARAAVSRVSFLAPSLVVAVAWALLGSRARIVPSGGEAIVYQDPRETLALLPSLLWDVWKAPWDAYAPWVAMGAVALPGVLSIVQARDWKERWRPWLRERRLLVVAFVVASLMLLAMPDGSGWAFYLARRFAPVVWLLALLLVAASKSDPSRSARPVAQVFASHVAFTVVGLASLAQLAVFAHHVRLFSEEARPFEQVLAAAHGGKRLVGLMFDPTSRVRRGDPYVHFAAFYTARLGGFGAESFAEFPHMPVRIRKSAHVPREDGGWELHPCDFQNTYEGEFYDYVLSRGPRDPFRAQPGGPSWRRVAKAGAWWLFERDGGRWPVRANEVGPCGDARTPKKERELRARKNGGHR